MEENKAAALPDRDPTAERLEREAYVVLLHVFNVSGASPEGVVAEARLSRDLAFDRPQVALLLDHLVMSGYVSRPVEGGLHISPRGIEYIQRAARNRRSVRYEFGPAGTDGARRWMEYRRDG